MTALSQQILALADHSPPPRNGERPSAVQPAAWPRMHSRRPAVEQLAQLLEPRHPRDVALNRRAARYAIPNSVAKAAAPTHRLVVQLENAPGTSANRANERRPFAAVGKALVNNLDLTSETVVTLAENNLD